MIENTTSTDMYQCTMQHYICSPSPGLSSLGAEVLMSTLLTLLLWNNIAAVDWYVAISHITRDLSPDAVTCNSTMQHSCRLRQFPTHGDDRYPDTGPAMFTYNVESRGVASHINQQHKQTDPHLNARATGLNQPS